MYWQVYLHKTAVACEKVLVNVLLRAKQLANEGKELFAPPSLRYFLHNNVDSVFFHSNQEALQHYIQLDDNDIWSSVKVWINNEDKILSILSRDLIERNIFEVEVHEDPITEERIDKIKTIIAEKLGVSMADTNYLISVKTVQKDMYDINDDHISILYKDGTCKDIADASEILNIALLSKKIRKYYLCYQRF